jgi:hypothetical protein
MTGTGRLFWIETRRNVGLLAFPLLIGLAWLAWLIQRQEEQHTTIALWPQTSVDIAFAVAFLGPAAGGLAAWMAGRDRRRGLSELLKTTPAPATKRDMTLLAATTLWALLAFLAAGAYLGIVTAREATWGGPAWPPIFIAGLAIASQAAIGYAAGSFVGGSVPSRLMAGLVPIVLFFSEVLPGLISRGDVPLGPTISANSYPYENLAPWAVVRDIAGTVFWEPRMDLVWSAAAWYVGLGGLALATILLRRYRTSLVGWGTLAAAALALVVGWTQLVPAKVFDVPSASRAVAYEPVCTQDSFAICLHPAYESVLDDTAALVDAVVSPLVGLPAFPVRAEQVRPVLEGEAIDETAFGPVEASPYVLAIMPADPQANDGVEAAYIATAAVAGQTDRLVPMLNPAQSAIASWLMDQSGLEWSTAMGVLFPPVNEGTPIKEAVDSGMMAPDEADDLLAQIELAADRFGALTPEAQHAWLEANFAALRAGDLTLDDLP